MKRTFAALLTAATLTSPAIAAASPSPDPTPQSVHRYAEICPAPYHRVQVRVSVYHREPNGHLRLVRRYWVGKPYLTGGYNPKRCHRV
jgi:hypothetical protein